jgi:uncharacterized protein YidB (DUF937 family)
MLENLLNLVKENAGEAIINNPAIPNHKNDEVINDATQSITGSLQNMLASGNMKDVLSMFSNNASDAQNQASSVMQNNFVKSLMDKVGLDQNNAQGIASSLIPQVLNQFVSKTNEPENNGFDLQGIMNQLSGGKTTGFDIGGLLNKMNTGLLDKDGDGDGDTDLKDVMAMLNNGNQSNSSSNLLDKVKGFFN